MSASSTTSSIFPAIKEAGIGMADKRFCLPLSENTKIKNLLKETRHCVSSAKQRGRLHYNSSADFKC